MLRFSSLFALSLAACTFASASTPNYSVVAKFAVPGDGGWDYLSVDSGAHRLYISRGTHVQVMDTQSGKMVGDILGTNGVHGIAIDAKLHKGFTSNGRDNSVTVFDTRTLRVLATVKVGQGPDAIIFDPASDRVFTFNGGGGDATAIDAKSNAVAGTVKLDGRPEYPQPDGHGSIFVNIEDKSEVQQVDSRALTAGRTWPLAPGDGPSGLSIDPKNHRTFSTCGNNIFAISDTQAGKMVGQVRIGNGPDAAGFDPGLGVAFSSNGEGTLTVVARGADGSYSVAQEVKTQQGARTMAVDPKTHRVYLIAAQYQAAPAGSTQRRRTMVPGSTVILVVAPN